MMWSRCSKVDAGMSFKKLGQRHGHGLKGKLVGGF